MKKRMVLEKCLKKEEGSEMEKEVASFLITNWLAVVKFSPYLPTEHRGTIGTFERIPEYIIADFPMVAKLSPRTIGRSPRVDSPLKSTQNFGL